MATEIDVKQELTKISDQLKEHGQKALSEAQRGIAMSEGVKQTVDELLVKQGNFAAQLAELEQKAARRQTEQTQGAKSLGAMFVDNDAFKKAHESGELHRKGGRITLDIETKAVLTANTGAGVIADRQPGIITQPQRRLTIRDLIAPGRTASNMITYMKETGFTNNAAPTAEGARKPESSIVLTQSTAPVIKIPHFMKASTEILDDFPALQSYIDERLTYGLKLAEENQMLKGSGVGNNLNGIYTQASAYVAPIAIAGATHIDILRLALLQADLAEYPSDGLVLHPSNWAGIELLKDTTGQYIIGNPQGTLAPTLWGRPVVTTQAMSIATFLAGAFRMGAQVFDRLLASVSVATENEDDFVMNLVTILIEERLALVVNRPEAFVKGALA
ncbi:phage major capsid protein [Massilia violaceinigra]|uniref:Phage major capsid protein n=1 Tax=Massilia violaceinigra TaxID=2045208 RepID=A0A2D2DIQ2_9BURK|nr:phage major capsid protein [Massilia violaceinigra]ATQ74849.1 phage major capsid protein [Massilia violaceinigra]ATQ78628.1 phage major capsid protein [Massilia violaceinigra]